MLVHLPFSLYYFCAATDLSKNKHIQKLWIFGYKKIPLYTSFYICIIKNKNNKGDKKEMEKRESATAQSGNTEEPVKKRYDFFCRSTGWVRCYQGEMTEEEAIKHAKNMDMRFEEAM